MKPFIINKSSWHYKLVDRLQNQEYDAYDFCEYTRRLMKALLLCVLMALAAGLLASMPIDFIYWMYLLATAGAGYNVIPGPPGILFVLIIITGCAIKGISRLIDWAYARQWDRGTKPTKQPGFIKTWYETASGKFCIPVEYTEPKE
jgi:hypothetical protein